MFYDSLVFYTLQVSDTWLISTVARRVYISAALLTVYFVGLLTAIVFGTAFAEGSLAQSPLLATFLRVLLFPGIIGTAVLWIGMWYFWYRFHPNDGMSKAVWAAGLLVVGPLGALLYFFFFYLRPPLLRTAAGRQAATA